MMNPFILFLAILPLLSSSLQSAEIAGLVNRGIDGIPLANVRITLFRPDLRFFREVRTGADGRYTIKSVPEGNYQLGAALPRFEYSEASINVIGAAATRNFTLPAETQAGRWTIVGNTTPELLDGTGSGSLLPSGELLVCHNEIEPVAFEPVSATKWFPPGSGSVQGCHVTSLLSDGRLLFVGGSMNNGNPQDPIPRTVKVFNRFNNSWAQVAQINIGRWYPGIVRLPDERLLVVGGELDGPTGRTNTCEIYDPVANTWTMTGSFNLPTEIPPTFMLYTGEVFKSWRYPELYNLASGQWRAGPNMMQTRNGAAGGGHCDHEALMLEDGRILAVGIDPVTLSAATRFTEIYDPVTNSWSLGPNARHLRTQPEAIMLPDSRVLTFGGQYTGTLPATTPLQSAGLVPNCTKVADLYDPASNSFRTMADMNRFIHYHSIAVLAADGRVLATGGAGGRSLFGNDASIEAFEPPYLFRGVRPRITNISKSDLVAGGNFTMEVVNTTAVTKVALVGVRNSTHWIDGGPQRILPLGFTQSGASLNVTLPSDTVRLLPGYYLLFAMVDDIPSVARVVRVTASVAPAQSRPVVSIALTDASTGEPANAATFTITRTGVTTAPLVVPLDQFGSAVNGRDFASVPAYVVIPAGQAIANFSLLPIDDNLAEGPENITFALPLNAGFAVNSSLYSATLSLGDNEAEPLPAGLAIGSSAPSLFELTLTGIADRRYLIESSEDLFTWVPLTEIVTDSVPKRITDLFVTPKQFFRAR